MKDYIKLTESQAKTIFEKWMNRYQADPNSFDHDTRDVESYGEGAQRTLFSIYRELFPS